MKRETTRAERERAKGKGQREMERKAKERVWEIFTQLFCLTNPGRECLSGVSLEPGSRLRLGSSKPQIGWVRTSLPEKKNK